MINCGNVPVLLPKASGAASVHLQANIAGVRGDHFSCSNASCSNCRSLRATCCNSIAGDSCHWGNISSGLNCCLSNTLLTLCMTGRAILPRAIAGCKRSHFRFRHLGICDHAFANLLTHISTSRPSKGPNPYSGCVRPPDRSIASRHIRCTALAYNGSGHLHIAHAPGSGLALLYLALDSMLHEVMRRMQGLTPLSVSSWDNPRVVNRAVSDPGTCCSIWSLMLQVQTLSHPSIARITPVCSCLELCTHL